MNKQLWVVIALGTVNLLLGLTLLITWLGTAYTNKHKDKQPSFGVSFSTKYSQELGLDWREVYLGILQDLKPSKMRLMSYWDVHEPQKQQFEFNDLDWMFDKAHEYRVPVSLAIGLRQPRWPECHQPGWAGKLSEGKRNQQLIEYLAVVVNRYKNHPALFSWQLENEAANQLFGHCPDFDKKFHEKEFNTVKALDRRHPLVTNASNQIGFPLRKPVGERLGFSIYRHATPRIGESSFSWSYWFVPSLWHGFRAQAVENLHRAETFIHELQAEPWTAEAITSSNITEQNELMNPVRFKEYIDYALSTGIKEIDLWGAEWWYWRRAKFNDPLMWDTARSIFENTATN